MPFTFGFFTDAGLTTVDADLQMEQDSLGSVPPDDDVRYVGSAATLRRLRDNADPGVNPLLVQLRYTLATWAATTAKSLGDYVIPTAPNGYKYRCTTAGTTAGTQPTWPTTVGATVTDGSAIWTCERSHLITEFKLAATSGGLAGATAGAPLSLGVQVTSGAANAVPVYVRFDDATGTLGTLQDIKLSIVNVREDAV
jgi:hypothetical protein